ncbi:zinc finger protein 526-like isoform X2 [Hippoglossus hippoglossus]|uniref:zinc finger protein 526-like isoform X2 n=1 Tax=Hippoglossus hippoglossus TaxID=8267 RepID=UPI00148DCD75|nr:zinc finger protein 526-like isoform X2 [Hippoglossus hippoglossus]
MSDLDSLIVTFQTQLSDVMESVVKTAMYEVTRLVEDGFLKEVETLRMQLQWTEKKLSDREGEKTGRCVDCAKKDVELSPDTAGERCDHQHDDVLRVCAVKKEGSPVERWTQGHRREVVSELPQEADNASAAPSPERESQAAEEVEGVPAVDVKEEHLGGWSDTLDGKAGLESQSITERTEAQPKQTPENSEELLRDIMTQGPQISAAFCFPEELEETHMATDPSHIPALEMDTSWTGLLLNHRLGAENDHDSAKTRASLKRAEHELSESVTADVHAQATQNATSGCSEARLQNSKTLGVKIKQEITIDSDGCEESEHPEKKEIPKSGMKSFSCSLKQHRLSSEAHKRNHIYRKATVQEVVKLHSKAGTGLKLQAAIQHLHRPLKKHPHTLSNSSTAAFSLGHSQVVNSNPLSRIPSTSKAAPPPPLSAQRVHLVDKQAAPLSRTGAPWVSVRSQSSISHHASPVPHTDSHTGPRNILRCGQCGKCFPHPSNLKAHLQTHTGERPFCCSLCGRSFTKLSNLKAHRRVHTGERPYCCLACGKRFTQKCNLKRHQRIHLDV